MKSASRLPLAVMNEPCQGLPLLSTGRAPAPATMACWTSVPPTIAATVGSSCTASSVMPSGDFSSSCAIIVASISTWPISSAPMPNTMSRYLPGMCMFHAWNWYCMATEISPYWPPSTSCSLRA
ncbi:hypothetical protein ASF75_14720 [Curtobacterium sp. Leaf154]|nr:hypothetical protein ASF75_14720 [Curtobacterium sp. Leaf154]